jgi:hypothetical protein
MSFVKDEKNWGCTFSETSREPAAWTSKGAPQPRTSWPGNAGGGAPEIGHLRRKLRLCFRSAASGPRVGSGSLAPPPALLETVVLWLELRVAHEVLGPAPGRICWSRCRTLPHWLSLPTPLTPASSLMWTSEGSEVSGTGLSWTARGGGVPGFRGSGLRLGARAARRAEVRVERGMVA